MTNIGTTLREQLDNIPNSTISGRSIAITVGSRGIAELVEIIRTLVASLHEKGAHPFIAPSMGSHGGATAQGQIKVLSSYGITEVSVDAPIRSSMDVVKVAKLADGTPLFTDRLALEADAIVIANKIKPHADFKAQDDAPHIQKIVALDVTPQSLGNGVGIGSADISTRACVEKIDLGAM